MDKIVEMERYDMWMHAKMEEEERQFKTDQALDELSKIVDGWIRESHE